MNPRDVLNHHLWWQSPDWLSLPLKAWPSSPAVVHSAEDVSAEAKATPSLLLLATTSPDGLEARVSCLTRMQRVLAYCQRFVHNARHPASRLAGHLSSAELHRALMTVVRQVQRPHSPRNARKPGSRHLVTAEYAHHLTTLIIDDAHHRLLHAGALATHAYIRQRFWIPDGRNVACNRCFTFKPTPIIQPLGSLPPVRVTAASAFITTGVDYAGPFFITSARLRGAAVTKAYLVVFICFATKAVHFEVASELSSAAFIAAYRRFVARRGHPTVIFSDNGTNFVGAHHELRDLSRLLSSPKHQQSLSAAASTCGTDWRFIPPASPHFGGLWEAAVKSAKHHLRRTIGDQRLTYEEFLTICTQVEAILNSRPLVAPSSDPTDLEALTPGHFLIGRPLTAVPEHDFSPVPLTRLSRWQLLQRIQQDFWKRWSREYLHTLQQRTKWLEPSSPVSPGLLVLIKEDHLPPQRWLIGRIIALFPGPDGVARVADVRTSSGTLRRPLCKLCPLPSQ
ncbi:hypothetical protein KPH14_000887 [Odynerus spinipes]|uniref:Integrase catalytic domain-containing protein n=1 Tax=Odynerus spinipes TaxID=1348599 RepID=A0AAD9REH4_9HYME|nr:hypothetical protein KPH14_000887 [Odynerus spinipes]